MTSPIRTHSGQNLVYHHPHHHHHQRHHQRLPGYHWCRGRIVLHPPRLHHGFLKEHLFSKQATSCPLTDFVTKCFVNVNNTLEIQYCKRICYFPSPSMLVKKAMNPKDRVSKVLRIKSMREASSKSMPATSCCNLPVATSFENKR